MVPEDLFDRINETRSFLESRGVREVDVGMILGSGMSEVAEMIVDPLIIPYSEIPNWAAASVVGHKGELRYGSVGQKKVLIFSGRLHYYEGYAMWQVAFAMHLLRALRAGFVITTGAAGGLNPEYAAGDLVLLHDHISFMPDNPLRGFHDDRLGERFPDMSEPYDTGLRLKALRIAGDQGWILHEGVYAGLAGPSLETKSEYLFLGQAGADLVGMSIIPDAIVAAQGRLPLLGICIVSNPCYPNNVGARTTVEEIIRVVQSGTVRMADLFKLLLN